MKAELSTINVKKEVIMNFKEDFNDIQIIWELQIIKIEIKIVNTIRVQFKFEIS